MAQFQTNQAVCRQKLLTKLTQGERQFSVWYPKVKEQALRCLFKNYDSNKPTRNAILYKTSDSKLQREVLSKDLDMELTI